MKKADEINNALCEELAACETRVWSALVEGDASSDAAMLDSSFLGVYQDGFSGKSDHVDQLADGPTIASYSLSGFRCRKLGENHALLSYRSDFRRCGKTHKEAMYISSIWERTGKGWINVFSQDTFASD